MYFLIFLREPKCSNIFKLRINDLERVKRILYILILGWLCFEIDRWQIDISVQNLMQICGSTCSIILNVTATQYTCSLNGVYCPHWLVQWSHHCSPMCMPVHSPWLPGYIDVVQTIPIILTMAGLFLDKIIYMLKLILAYFDLLRFSIKLIFSCTL